MLGDSGYELFRCRDGKVLFVFAVGHPGMVDHHAGIMIVVQFGDGKRTANDVLGQVGHAGCIITGYANGIIHAEAGGMPPLHYHSYEGIIDQAFFFEHGQDIGPKQFCQWFDVCLLWHDMEHAAAPEEPVGDYCMDMRMPFCIITKGLNGQYSANDSIIQSKDCPEKYAKAVGGTAAEPGEQFTVVKEKLTQDYRDRKDILAVGQGVENVFPKQFTELNHLFCVATWAEPAAPAGKGQQVFVMTVRAADPGETLLEIAAFEIGAHHLGDNQAVDILLGDYERRTVQ